MPGITHACWHCADQVEKAYQQHLMQGEAAEELIDMGQTGAGLDILAQRGDWVRLFDTAAREKVAPGIVGRYVALHIEAVLKEVHSLHASAVQLDRTRDGKEIRSKRSQAVALLQTAVSSLTQHGLPSVKEHLGLYEALTGAVLGLGRDQEEVLRELEVAESATAGNRTNSSSSSSTQTIDGGLVGKLRGVLFELVQKGSGKRNTRTDTLEHLLMASHYMLLMQQCQQQGSKDCTALAAKIAVTLLRYCDIIPPDKCFYQAGQLCRDLSEESLAFVLLNRYVDVTEAVDEHDASLIDNSDFAHATAVPIITTASLPHIHYIIDESKREEVRDWVLGVCVDAKVEQQLPAEVDCKGTIFEGLFNSDAPSCIVTGYPVHKQLLEVNGSKASKRDWNMFVRYFKRCPWTGAQQNPQY